MSAFINQDTGEAMTVQEARRKYGNVLTGQLICPLCGACNWLAGSDADDLFYFLECDDCHTYLVEDE